MLLLLAIIFFSLAAILGIYLLSYVLTEKNTPKGVALIHGAAASVGLVLLIIYSLLYQTPVASLLVFILAALGGLYLFYRDITGKEIPKFLAIGHGSIAVIGFILLLIFAFYF
ncbi:hypothetical protein [Legionella jamestowniensis]|uniref:Transmembrane protein n=1 Tax=Legionella jamestowniensis TaxID=455 RepID=A0A0W0UTW6_9GAMM|nr:hypothetical protein [Legionella jamestowniensis]KTD11299.1 hypothetical protein Ljam_0493 [Legionella jamestowniensis]OCH98152.1 hypothetical protein A8135_13425 [Legionella jamestowniensis]SFL69407.1 hypothetical protein SAMN02746073_1421 [Legionella jamestowniensis DSM 19215]